MAHCIHSVYRHSGGDKKAKRFPFCTCCVYDGVDNKVKTLVFVR